ncbi:hypothetical protein LXL04_006763 [Taraxacum kok-saghyz]
MTLSLMETTSSSQTLSFSNLVIVFHLKILESRINIWASKLFTQLQYLSLARTDVLFAVTTYSSGNQDDGCSTNPYIGFRFKSHLKLNTKLFQIPLMILWDQNLLLELGTKLPQPPILFCDNMGATSLRENPVFHSHMKQISLD